MPKLSFVTTAYNEEKKIHDCLESIKNLADEIIVVNNSSTDKTVEKVKKFTKHVFTKENNLMLNVNKNFGFSKATGEWILNLDPDERLSPELAQEIKNVLDKNDTEIDGYYIPRKNIIFGKWIQHSLWWPDYQLRLFRKNKGIFSEKHVHELLEVTGKTEKLTHPMVHLNYESVSQYIQKLDTIYTENEVQNFIESKKPFFWFDAIRMPSRDFMKTFFAQQGYKDGLHGLVLSLFQAFYSFVVFAKVWEKQGFIENNSSNFLQDVSREIKKYQ